MTQPDNKPKKKGMFSFMHTMRAKLMASLLVISIVPTATLGIMTQQSASHALMTTQSENAEDLAEQVSMGISKYAQGIGAQINMLSSMDAIGDESGKNKGETKELLKQVKESRPDILCSYFATSTKEMSVYPATQLPEGFDPTTRDWYQSAVLNKGNITLNEPYVDAGTGKFVVTVSETVEKNGEVIGVLGFDVSLGAIQTEVKDSKVGVNGFVFIVDTDGTLVAHPDNDKLGKEIGDEEIWTSTKDKKSGTMTYEYKGEEHLLSHYTDPKTGWTFFASIPMEEVHEEIATINHLIVLGILGFSVLAGILAFVISRRIVANLESIKVVFEEASKGDFTQRAEIKGKDEFHHLGNSFNDMMDSFSETLHEVKRSSAELFDTSEGLEAMSEESNESVLQVANAIQEIASGASASAENTQTAVEEIGELAKRMDGIASSAETMKEASTESYQLSHNGLTVVGVLSEKTEMAKETSHKAGDIVKSVDGQMEKINQVMNTMTQITDQTNLLSLNASIESARAGEYGKGFGVVAQEIRNLADQSKKSGMEIQEIIQMIQSSSKEAVNAMDASESILNEQYHAVQETKDIFRSILTSVEEVTKKVEAVQAQLVEAEKKKENVVHEMENNSAIAQQTASSSQEVSAATEEVSAGMEEFNQHASDLNQLAGKLKGLVNQFKLDTEK
ncbi:methyl-accepting chemotaxis protein [Rossellomorea marisflavi]|uniref:methyl-accepting chemotaxis protein n=1 Tax=Rossellomorea marisflavi TaxID=189381 RepID=UPI003FA10E7F